VEGKRKSNGINIFYSMAHYKAFIDFGKGEMGWVPHTIGNKAKVFSQVTFNSN